MSVLNSFRALLPPVSSSLGRIILRAAQPAILLPVGATLAGERRRFPVLFIQRCRSAGQFAKRGAHLRGEGNLGLFHARVFSRVFRAVTSYAATIMTPEVTR